MNKPSNAAPQSSLEPYATPAAVPATRPFYW